MRYPRWTLPLILISLLTGAQAPAQQHDMPINGQQPTADQAMMAGMAKMNRGMSAAPMTGNADQDFVAMMIPHHQGAVDMAEVELRYGKDPSLHRLATQIVAAQRKEIAMMQRWQAAHHIR